MVTNSSTDLHDDWDDVEMDIDINADEEDAEENPAYENFAKIKHGWLYIAVDIRDLRISKIGLTSQENPNKRVAQGRTYNPFITLFTSYDLSRTTFGISKEELKDIESYMLKRSIFGDPLKHLDTANDSEWFYIDPEEAESQINYYLTKRGFSVDGKTLQSYSQEDDVNNGINIERLNKIKTSHRPKPQEFLHMIKKSQIPFEFYEAYYQLLVDHHKKLL